MNEHIIELPELGEITVDFETGPEITIEATGVPGRPGGPGEPGFSPTVTVTDITGGHRITITDATGAHSFDVMDGEGGVTDVQVNGTSVVTDGVANVPVASGTTPGVARVYAGYGFRIVGDYLRTNPASAATIKGGGDPDYLLVPYNQHIAVFYGLAKAAGAHMASIASTTVGVYPEAQKSAISTMLNAPVTVTGTTPTITALSGIQYVCGEVSTLDITLPASGIVDVVFESGSTPTVLNVTPQTGMTVEWANGFDTTSLEADTLYELNIRMVGTKCLGVAGAWS